MYLFIDTFVIVRLEDLALRDLIVFKGKGELPTSLDCGVIQCPHLTNNDH